MDDPDTKKINLTNTTGDNTQNKTTSVLSQDSGESSTKDIKTCYVFTNMLVIALGFMQFGLGMSNWTPVAAAFQCKKEWSDDDTALYGDII